MVGIQILLPTIFCWKQVDQYPELKRSCHNSVDLLIADVGVLDPSEELDEIKELVQRKLLIVH